MSSLAVIMMPPYASNDPNFHFYYILHLIEVMARFIKIRYEV